MSNTPKELEWKMNTGSFLKEVFDNYPGQGGVLAVPANILRTLLAQVAARAAELNDPVMNALMCRMALYGESDPYDKENYNPEMVIKVLNHPDYLKYKKRK